MVNKKMIGAFSAGALCMGTLAFAIAAGPEDAGEQEMSAAAMAEMESWMALGAPGEQHKMLARSVGEWDAKTWFKMDPNAPATEGTGSMTAKSIMDGRYIKGHFKMDFMGAPFEGVSYIGYDNGAQKFVSSWIDTMSTGIYTQKGTMSADGKSIIMMGTMTGPEGEQTMKMVTEFVDDNTMRDTMYDLIDGEWHKHGKITYTRKGHAHAGG